MSKLSLYFSLPNRSVMSSAQTNACVHIHVCSNYKCHVATFQTLTEVPPTWNQLHQTVQTLLLGLLSLRCTALCPGLGRQGSARPHSLLQHLKVNHPAGGAGEVGNSHLQPSEAEVFRSGISCRLFSQGQCAGTPFNSYLSMKVPKRSLMVFWMFSVHSQLHWSFISKHKMFRATSASAVSAANTTSAENA